MINNKTQLVQVQLNIGLQQSFYYIHLVLSLLANETNSVLANILSKIQTIKVRLLTVLLSLKN